MHRYDWARLTPVQRGRYAEYFAKMEFTLYGCDVYTAEVDDHGIDFVIRTRDGRYFDVQVKSIHDKGYVFFPKDKFELRDTLLASVVLFMDGCAPQIYLIPSTAWYISNDLLVSHEYEGKKSAPEWGLNLSRKNRSLLDQFIFDRVTAELRIDAAPNSTK